MKRISFFILTFFTFTVPGWALQNPCTAGQTWDTLRNVCIPAAANTAVNANVNANANVSGSNIQAVGTVSGRNSQGIFSGVSDADRMLNTGLPGTNTVTGPVTPANSPNDTTPSAAMGSSTLGPPGEAGVTTANSAVPNVQVYGTNGSVLTGSKPFTSVVAAVPVVTNVPTVSGTVSGNAAVTTAPVPAASPSPVGQSMSQPTTTGASANQMAGASPPPAGTLTSSNTGNS